MTHRGRRLGVRTAILLAAGTLLAAAAPAMAIDHAGAYWGLVLAAAALGLLAYLLGASRVVPEVLNWGVGLLLASLVAAAGFSPERISPLVLVEGACLYAAAELGWLAANPPPVLTAGALLLRGLIVLGGLVVGYLALFGLVLPGVGGPLITVLGVAAAVLAFFLLRGTRSASTVRAARPPRRR